MAADLKALAEAVIAASEAFDGSTEAAAVLDAANAEFDRAASADAIINLYRERDEALRRAESFHRIAASESVSHEEACERAEAALAALGEEPSSLQKAQRSGEAVEQAVDWAGASKVHDWRNHVPEEVRAVWGSFSGEQRAALQAWAEELANREDWD